MNAETRAKEAVRDLLSMVAVNGSSLALAQDLANNALASALRQAENEKLEEAADAATKFLVGDPFNGVPLRSPGPHEIAAHIRSLKLKD